MWLNLSSLIGAIQTAQQCAAERYLISLIIIIPPDQSPPLYQIVVLHLTFLFIV